MAQPRVLVALTVYNGRAFVPGALHSARRLRATEGAEVDVLVLDDCSPDPGWGEELSALCRELELQYYRSPRNLGIVRNVNLGLLRAVSLGYDHVIVCNSDVVFPAGLVSRMLEVVQGHEQVGSVTAWSNNVSLYSLPNADADNNLADQGVVDWLSVVLEGRFGSTVLDVPTGISFCVMIPTEVLLRVGLMDPVFGRGYCEETDWSQRSLALGYRATLAPGVFVYHAGQGSSVDAGLVALGHSTVPRNEAIIDFRWPDFRQKVGAFVSTGALARLQNDGAHAIIRDAAGRGGYTVDVGTYPLRQHDRIATCTVVGDGHHAVARGEFLGFRAECKIESGRDVMDAIQEFMGGELRSVRMSEPGLVGDELLLSLRDRGVPVAQHVAYPRHV